MSDWKLIKDEEDYKRVTGEEWHGYAYSGDKPDSYPCMGLIGAFTDEGFDGYFFHYLYADDANKLVCEQVRQESDKCTEDLLHLRPNTTFMLKINEASNGFIMQEEQVSLEDGKTTHRASCMVANSHRDFLAIYMGYASERFLKPGLCLEVIVTKKESK